MNRLRKVLSYIRRSRVLKYCVVFRNKQKISELESEIARYRHRYEQDQAQLRRLDTDPKAIEKIARERYFMKADDEDIFVLSDDVPTEQLHEDETAE